MTRKWEKSEYGKCPQCETDCEMLVDDEGYHCAERCPKCRWVIRFDDE